MENRELICGAHDRLLIDTCHGRFRCLDIRKLADLVPCQLSPFLFFSIFSWILQRPLTVIAYTVMHCKRLRVCDCGARSYCSTAFSGFLYRAVFAPELNPRETASCCCGSYSAAVLYRLPCCTRSPLLTQTPQLHRSWHRPG